MRNFEKLISHTILAVDRQSEFCISMQCISEGSVYLDLWSCSNNSITHLKSKWVRFLTNNHIQEIAELWLEEHVEAEFESIASEKEHHLTFVRTTRKITPQPQQLGPLPFPINKVDIGGIDWSFVSKIR